MKAKPVGDLKIEYVRVDELKPAEYNPRKISAEDMEKLKESIERFGMIDPAIVNSAPDRKNIVIGGHQRLKAAVALGHALMPVVYVNIPDPAREKELNLRLNRNQGEFDEKLLAAFDDSLLKLVGFTKDEEEMRTKVGQLWELGDHRLRVAKPGHEPHRPKHSVEPDIVMDFRDMRFPDESFKLVVFDPPHFMGMSPKSWLAKKYGVLNRATWQDDIRRGFNECWRVLKPDGVLVVKWSEDVQNPGRSISTADLIKVVGKEPLFGHRTGSKSNTHWLIFMKL